jgi:hypothetical protein
MYSLSARVLGTNHAMTATSSVERVQAANRQANKRDLSVRSFKDCILKKRSPRTYHISTQIGAIPVEGLLGDLLY